MKVRTRYAPSPTGNMHIGNLKAALIEYLIAKSNGGDFVLRIEDTDRSRYVEGSIDVIYKTLKLVGLKHDEGPDIGGEYGPYVQSERLPIYMEYAKKLVAMGKAYYCFCSKERLESLTRDGAEDAVKYDRHCYNLSSAEVSERLALNESFVIRQLIPEGHTTFSDEVFGDITIENEELDDQILIKSDGLPTYNFANVIDDHLMEISHVIRGAEYLSSTPKYNLLYSSFGWEPPKYVHVGLVLNDKGEKMSKRRGDAGFDDLIALGYLPEAVVNYVALLGWCPDDNREIFTLEELCGAFSIKGMSKAPSSFDMQKLTWFNSEHIKKMTFESYFKKAEPYLKKAVTRGVDLEAVARMTQSRVNFISECAELVDFIDNVPEYDSQLYEHKKMKTDKEISYQSLIKTLNVIEVIDENDWNNDYLYNFLCGFAAECGLKNGQVLWPVRTALSGKPSSPCGATELMVLLGKEETVKRINDGITKLKQEV